MSDVDKKVVQIDFDNKKFEKNIKQSQESLGDLKKSLNFDGVSNSIDQVTIKINALEIATTTFIANLSNRIINLGITMVKSLSVDNISAGWTKYGQKTTAVATMMAQSFKIAGKELTNESEKMSAVTEQLERLSWFSDETSYTFTDMVDNVGKFIAAGQDLDISVKAMEGIATWAALSGQNATTASRAMYQLSQAMGKGKIQLIDYKSIQNANMDTVEFRQTILDTAVALGQLTKEGDKFVTKTGKKFTQSQFAEELSSGWFTSEVLVKGLEKYSSAVEEIYALAEKEGKTATEIIEEYGDTLDSFGLKAFKAAQEARTFSDVLNSIKDAVSSKWMTTSELIFGDKNQAIELWTSLSNALYEVFAESGNFRNEILKVWNTLGGREDLFKRGGKDQGAFWNIYDAIIAVKDAIHSAWNTIFPLSQMSDESDQALEIGNSIKTLTKRFQLFTKNLQLSSETSLRIRKIFEGIFSVLKFGLQVLQALRYILDPILELGKKIITFVLNKIVSLTESINISTNTLFKIAEKIGNTLNNLFISLKSGLNILKPIKSLIVNIGKFLSKIFKNVFKAGLSILDSFTTLIKNLSDILVDLFKNTLQSGYNILVSLKKWIININKSISNFFRSLRDSGKVQNFFNLIVDFFKKIISSFKVFRPLFESILKLFKDFIGLLSSIPRSINNAVKSLTGKSIAENIKWIFDSISNALVKFKNKVGSIGGKTSDTVKDIIYPIQELINGLISFAKGALSVVRALLATLGKVLNVVGSILQYIGDVTLNLYSGKKKLEEWQKILAIILASVAGLAILILSIVKIVYYIQYLFTALINPLSVIADSLSGVIDKLAFSMVANSINTIATSIFKIVAAVSLLATIETGKLWNAVGAVSVISAVLAALVALMYVISSNVLDITKTTLSISHTFTRTTEQLKGFTKNISILGSKLKENASKIAAAKSASLILKSFSNAMLKVAAAFIVLAKLGWEDLSKGIVVMVLLASNVIASSILIGKNGGEIAKAIPSFLQLLSFAVMLKVFASVLTSAKDFSNSQLLKSLAMFGMIEGLLASIMGMIIGISRLSFGKGEERLPDKLRVISNVLNSISLLLLSFSLTMKILSRLNWSSAGVMLGIIGAFFAELASLLVVAGRFGKESILSEKQSVSTANTIKSLSLLLLSFSATMGILSSLNWSSAGVMLGIIGAFFVELGLLLTIIENTASGIIGEKESYSSIEILKSMSLLLLSFGITMKMLTKLDWASAGVMIGIIGAFFLEFGFLVATIETFGTDSSQGINKNTQTYLMSISLFLLSFGFSVKKVAEVPWNKLLIATGAIAAVLLAFAWAISIISISSYDTKDAQSSLMMMTGLVVLIAVFSKELRSFEKTTFSDYSTGLVAFAILFATLIGVVAIMTTSNVDFKKAGSILLILSGIAGLMVAFGFAMQMLNDLSWQNILASALPLATLLGSLISITALMNNSKGLFSKAMGMFAMLIGLSGMIISFGYSMKMLTDVSWQNILASTLPLMALLGSLIAITALLSNSKGSGADLLLKFGALSVGLLAMSAALVTFTYVIKELSAINFSQIITSLVGLASAIAIFVVAGKLLAPLSGQILKVASAMLLVGMSLILIVTSLQMFANMVSKVSGVTTEELQASVASIGQMAESIANVVMDIITVVLEKIKENIPLIFSIFQEFLTNALDLLSIVIDKVSDVLSNILDKLNTWMPKLISLVGTIITETLGYLNDHISEITEKVVNIFVQIMNKLSDKMDDIIKSTISFLNSLFAALYRNTGLIHDMTSNLLKLLLACIKNLALDLVEVSGTLAEIILIFLAAAIRIVIASLGGIGSLLIELIAGILMLVVQISAGMANVLYEIFRTILFNGAMILAKVMRNLPGDFWITLKMAFQSLWVGILDVFYDITKNIPVVGDWFKGIRDEAQASLSDTEDSIKDIVSGDNVRAVLNEAKRNISKTVKDTANGVKDTTKESLENIKDAVNDAKKDYEEVFTDLGNSVTDGYKKGIEENSDSAVAAASDMASKSSEAVATANDSHSPSRVFEKLGLYTILGYVKGINENTYKAVDGMSFMAESAVDAAQEILDDQNGDDLTLKVGLDISSVEGQAQKVSDIMTGINNVDASVYGQNALYNARVIKSEPKDKSSSRSESTSNLTYNNVFNISSTDPQESADEIDKALSRQAMRAKLAHGNI